MSVYNRAQRVEEWNSIELPFPFRGVNSLLPQNRLPAGSAFKLENAEIHHLLLKKRWGTKAVGGTLTGRIQRLGSFLDVQGNNITIATTISNLYNFVGGAWISRLSGLAGVATILPTLTSYQNKIILCNGANVLQKWDGITALGSAIATAPIARAISNLGGRVLTGHILSGANRFTNRVKWSDFLNEEVWTGGSSGEADLIDTDDEIMAFGRLRDQVAVLRKRSIWTISTAESPLFYRFERAFEGLGTTAMGSVASVPGGVIFWGPDDLYLFNGANATPLLTKEFSLRKFIEERVTLAGLQRAVSAVYLSRSQYWIAMPLDGSADNNVVLVYDYDNRHMVGLFTFDWSGLGVAEFSAGTGVWNDFTDFWSAFDIPWSLMVSLTQERMLGARVANTQPLLYDAPLNDQGAGITTIWETALVNMAQEGRVRGTDLKMVHRVQIMGEQGTAAFTVELGFSHDGATITYTAPFTIDTTQPDWIFDPSIATEAQWWTVRITSTGINAVLRIASVVLWYSILSPQKVDARAFTPGGAQQGRR